MLIQKGALAAVPSYAVLAEDALAQVLKPLSDHATLQENLDAAFRQLEHEQPALAGFLSDELIELEPQPAQALAYFLFLLVFRAFRDHFGVTPEQVRAATCLDKLSLQEPIMMDSTPSTNLHPPRFETAKAMLVAGIGERYNHCDNGGANIPNQWQHLHQKKGDIPDRAGNLAFGVCCNGDDSGNFDYIAGVEVSDFSDLPREFARVRIPEQRYVVFTHSEHISTIRRTVSAIWNQWLPQSGLKVADAPNFERYDEKFDPATGNGGLEIWVPVKD